MLNSVKKSLSAVIVFLTISSFSLIGDNDRDMVFSFIPFKTKNMAAVNLKKIFQLYDYKDIYKLSFFDKKNKKGIFTVLSGIMKKAEIDPEIDLNYLLFTSGSIINIMDFEKLRSEIVTILKLSYNPQKLERAIMLKLKKLKIRYSRGKLKNKSIIYLGKDLFGYSVFLHDERTILIGKKSNIIEYVNTFHKDRKNILSNKEFKSALMIMRKNPILAYFIDFSKTFKDILDQNDDSFKMDLSKVQNFEGSVDSDKLTWSGEINIVSDNKKGNKLTENGLRKLLGMSAMGGKKYIKFTENIDINAGNKGIRIFFTFDVE